MALPHAWPWLTLHPQWQGVALAHGASRRQGMALPHAWPGSLYIHNGRAWPWLTVQPGQAGRGPAPRRNHNGRAWPWLTCGTFSNNMQAAADGTPQLPFRIGKYECRKNLGGNMADVYLSWDPVASRPVVVKILRLVDAKNESMRKRFILEAQLACRCAHPNVITTYDVGELDDGRPYIVMEWLGGESLRAIMNRGGLSNQTHALTVALQVARALGYLHQRGVIHRDVKPANVQVDPEWHTKLLDFGVARRDDSDLTMAGQIVGTLAYMGPEQIQGEKPGPALDIYAFGVLLFEMLTLRLPYVADTQQEIAAAILYTPPDLTALREHRVPEPVIAVVERCLAKKKEDRFPGFQPIVDALRSFATAEVALETGAPQTRMHEFATVDMPGRPHPQKTAKAGWKIMWAALIVVVVLAIGGFAVWKFAPQFQRLPATIQTATGEMVLVDGGEAKLGQSGAVVRQVAAFYIDRSEVSNRIWLRFCRQTGRPKPAEGRPEFPAVNVTFDDAQAFAAWAHKKLPNASEWEKAARGANGQIFPWGETFKAVAANLQASGHRGHPERVDSRSDFASPCGALNMLGNVWEWVDTAKPAPLGDAFNGYATGIFRDLNPPLSRDEPWFEIRGGSYLTPAGDDPASLVWDYVAFPARARQDDVGFRCAVEADKAASVPRN
jgi:formylglycine-generating enzyme required for sulfatase activity